MFTFLHILSALSLLAGIGTLVIGRSAVHEIGAYVLFLIFVVCLSSASIIEQLRNLNKTLSGSRWS